MRVIVDYYKCIGCGECCYICNNSVYEIRGSMLVIDDKKCVNCKRCLSICPTNAIVVEQ